MANLTPTAVSKSSNFVTGPSGDRTNDVLTDLLANRTEIYSNMTSIADEFYGATPPANPNVGRKWRCSTTAGLYLANTTYRWNGSAWAIDIAETVSVPQRNCVLEGPVNSSGATILFSAGTGLTCNLKATVRLSFANGFTSQGGASDYYEVISADAAAFWSALPINSTVQLYFDRDSGGTVTGGYSTLAPVYQNYAPTHSAGLNWFDTNTQKMFVSNGSAWTQVWRVFVGTATTNGTQTTAVNININNSGDVVRATDIITKGPSVDVRAFGAKGDGVTDDTAAIQAAIDYGGNILLPAGDFYIGTSTLTISSGKKLHGVGWGNSRLRTVSPTGHVIKVKSGSALWEISGLSIYNDLPQASQTGGAGIMLDTVYNGILSNIYIENTYNGVVFYKSGQVRVRNVDCYHNKGNGLYFEGSNGGNRDIFLSDMQMAGFMTGTSTPGSGVGIRLSDSNEAITFSAIEVAGWDYPLLSEAAVNSVGNRPAYNTFASCYFDSCTKGAELNNSIGFRFAACWFSNRPGVGCWLNTVDDTDFDGCYFVNNAMHGCVVSTNAKRTRFRGCVAAGNGTATANYYNGINIEGGTTDFIVQDCALSNSGYGFGSQAHGVYVAPGASDRYVITANLVSGNAIAGVSDNGTGTNKFVGNNV